MADRIVFVLTVVLAGVYLYATEQLPTLDISDPLGPKVFPRLIAIGLLLTAAALLVEIVRKRKTRSGEGEGTAATSAPWRPYTIVGAAVIWTFLYFAVFERLGYSLATALYLLGLMAYFHRGKWTANVLTSVLYSFISYALFSNLLDVRLPPGILPF